MKYEYSANAIKTGIVLPFSLAGFIQCKDRNGTWENLEDPLIFRLFENYKLQFQSYKRQSRLSRDIYSTLLRDLGPTRYLDLHS